MSEQEQFNALSVNKKFQFLYYVAEANKDFLLEWIETDFVQLGSVEGGFDGMLNHTFAYLKNVLFPELNKKEVVEDVSGGIDMFIEWMEDTSESETIDRAYATAYSVSSLLQFISNYCFEFGGVFYEDEATPIIAYAFMASGKMTDEDIREHLSLPESITDWNELPFNKDYQAEFSAFFNEVMTKIK